MCGSVFTIAKFASQHVQFAVMLAIYNINSYVVVNPKTYIAENNDSIRVVSGYDKGNDVEVQKKGPHSNNVVEVGAGYTNQPALM